MTTRRCDLKRKSCNRLSADIGKVWSKVDGVLILDAGWDGSPVTNAGKGVNELS